MHSRLIAVVFLMSSMVLATVMEANAANVRYRTKIVRTLQDDTDNRFAGCMLLLDDDPAARGEVNCRAGWVTADCSGELGTSRAHSTALFNAGQAAMILAQSVCDTLDDSRTASRHCLLEILEAFPPSN